MSAVIQTDKPYAVLELPVGNDVESTIYAVPACTLWLKNITITRIQNSGKLVTCAAECKWPSNESKLNDYLEKKKKPTSDWVTFENVKILKFCKSARQAKDEAEKALHVSDLSQSDKETNIKRIRFITKRYSPPFTATSVNQRKCSTYSDSDSDVDLRPGSIKRLKINDKSASKSQESQKSDAIDLMYSSIDESMNDNINLSTSKNSNVLKDVRRNEQNNVTVNDNNESRCFCTTIQAQDSSAAKSQEYITSEFTDILCSSTDESIKKNINFQFRPTGRQSNVSNDLQINEQDNIVTDNDNNEDPRFSITTQQAQDRRIFTRNSHNKLPVTRNSELKERSIMTAICDMRSRLEKLHETVTQIYIATCHPAETPDNCIEIPTLPITSMKDFYIWDKFISNEEKKLIMIRLFKEQCMGDVKSSIYSMMRKLMTNKLAINFNLKGINREGARIQKIKFQSTVSYSIIIATLRRHVQEKTDRGLDCIYNKEIVDAHISNWLKDVKKRLENEKLRIQKNRKQNEEEEEEEEKENSEEA